MPTSTKRPRSRRLRAASAARRESTGSRFVNGRWRRGTEGSQADDERRRLDELGDEDEDDGTRAIWAAFERDGGGRPLAQTTLDVDALKERLKRGARRRAGQAEDKIG